MLVSGCKIWVVGRGFIDVADVGPGDVVHTLKHGLHSELCTVESVGSEFISDKINIIFSGQHSVNSTDDTRHLFVSDDYGCKYLKHSEIITHVGNKTSGPRHYRPLLTYPDFSGQRAFSDSELDGFARCFSARIYDESLLDRLIDTGSFYDHYVFIDLMESWCSIPPGEGWFGRVQVKARAIRCPNRTIALKIAKIAVLAGFTSSIAMVDHSVVSHVNISFEYSPTSGSKPPNQKYFLGTHVGMVYRINADNRPILGLSNNKCFYLPASSTLNE